MFLTNVAASGTPVSIGEAAITALLGYAVVFLGLLMLMIVVIITSKIISGAKKEEAAAPAAAPAPVAAAPAAAAPAAAPCNVPAPGSAGQILLVDTTEKDAALIMAIVANKLGKPINELRFVSIKKEVK